MNTTLKTDLADFNTSVSQLKADLRNDKEIEQNHFGDYLMIVEPAEWSAIEPNYKVWLNHPENVAQGEPVWQIECAYKGKRYTWETIAQG